MTADFISSEAMTVKRKTLQADWPDGQLTASNLGIRLHFKGKPSLPALRAKGWEVEKNSEFTCVRLDVTSYPKTFNKWVDVLGQVGQPYNVLITAPPLELLLPRPVCTYSSPGCLFLHYMNVVPCLKALN